MQFKRSTKVTFKFCFVFGSLLAVCQMHAQSQFTKRDSLHGGIRPERSCYDVRHYGLDIRIDPTLKTVKGFNDIDFTVNEGTHKIQLDLFANMQVDSIVWKTKKLAYQHEFDAVFIDFPETLPIGSAQQLRFYYSGKPIVAKNAPWDGGFVFTQDKNGNDWVAVAVQGTGASLWYPCKDSQTDEPDNGAILRVAVPDGLMNVSNGRFKGSQNLGDGYTRWDWEVKNPINNYDITVNIGDYIHFGENYKGLDLDYYVLRDNESKARKQFEGVKPMLDCFQEKFGPYPFTEDGYKLVETPYLGMEHQSAVAYGNKFRNGYRGSDLSGTGIGLGFDYIIVHESGHEWFGNSITSADIADMWIHEGFTMYSEVVYIECTSGRDKAMAYLNGLKRNIENAETVQGKFGVNNEGAADMYYKGAWIVQTMRSILNDDSRWWPILLEYATAFRHKIIDTKAVEEFFSAKIGFDLKPVFAQYLQHTRYPLLQLRYHKNKIQYRWQTDVANFKLPFEYQTTGKSVAKRLMATNDWQTLKGRFETTRGIEILTNQFLISVERLD